MFLTTSIWDIFLHVYKNDALFRIEINFVTLEIYGANIGANSNYYFFSLDRITFHYHALSLITLYDYAIDAPS